MNGSSNKVDSSCCSESGKNISFLKSTHSPMTSSFNYINSAFSNTKLSGSTISTERTGYSPNENFMVMD